MRTRWISPQFVSTNRVDSVADYQELRDLGARVNEVLGHRHQRDAHGVVLRPKGLRFSEIGCRPPGVGAWDLYSADNDIDVYREWANVVVHGHVGPTVAAVAPGIVALRPDHDGQITGYSGVDEAQAPPRGVGDRRQPAGARHAHPAGRGRLLGERLRADAPPRLRHAARHARRRGPHACTCTPGEGVRPRSAAPPHPGPRRRGARPGGAGRDGDGRLAGARTRRHRAPDALSRRPQQEPRPHRALARTSLARRPRLRRRGTRSTGALRRAPRSCTSSGSRPRCRGLRRVARYDGDDAVRSAARTDAEAVVRLVDDQHLARVREARVLRGHVAAGASAMWSPSTDPPWSATWRAAASAPGGDRRERGGAAPRAAAVRGARAPRRLIAWSAGAMALTERVPAVPRPHPVQPVGRGVPRQRRRVAARLRPAAARAQAAADRRPGADGRAGRAGRPRRAAWSSTTASGSTSERTGSSRRTRASSRTTDTSGRVAMTRSPAINRLRAGEAGRRRGRQVRGPIHRPPRGPDRRGRAGARSCGAARPMRCTSWKRIVGLPFAFPLRGCRTSSSGTRSWSCRRGRGSTTSSTSGTATTSSAPTTR